MKKRIAVLSLIFFLTPAISYAQTRSWEIRPTYPDLNQPLGQAGSVTNPWVVREKWNGDLEMKSKYPDLNQPLGTPGSPTNPIIIKRER